MVVVPRFDGGGLMFPDAGKRDRQITIQQRSSTDTVDSSGTPTEIDQWTTLRTVWAEKIEIGGREKFAAAQLSAPYDTRWRLPYRPDMDPELLNVPKLRRVKHKANIHDIVEARLIDRRHGVELLTLSGGTQA